MTQRELGKKLRKPHSYIYKCEVGNRRLDAAEFILWCRACGVNAPDAIRELDRLI